MTMNVLLRKDQISSARESISRQGLSALDSPLRAMARKLGVARGIAVGDYVKSWDVEAALSFIQQRLAKDAPIADIGCFASEVLVALHMAGYSNLTGIDLNERLSEMPFNGPIKYEVSDFTSTPFAAESFAAITSISVIEHGFDAERLMTEMSRLLKAGGYFFASFDYWPDKIATGDIKFFGMPWLIFSRADVQALIECAARHGMAPLGDLSFDAQERPIDCGGKTYTFAYLLMQKGGAGSPR